VRLNQEWKAHTFKKEMPVKKEINCLIFVFFIVFAPAVWGEQTIDQKIAGLEKKLPEAAGKEKVDMLYQLSSAYIYKSADRCIQYGTQALKLARELRYAGGEANAYNNIAIGSTILGDHEKGRECFEKALDIFEKIGDRNGISRVLNNLGSFYRRLSNYEKALELYLRTLEIEEKSGTGLGVALAFFNIGNVHGCLSNYDKSLEYYLKALNLYEELGDINRIADSLYSIGLLYNDLGKTDSALEYLQKAIKIYDEQGNTQGYSDSLMVIGIAYKDLNNYKSALEYFQKALEMAEKLRDKRGITYALGNIGSVYGGLKDYRKALEYFHKCLKIEKEIGDKRKMALTLISLGNCCAKVGEFDKSLDYLEKAIQTGKEIKVKGLLKSGYEELSQLYAGQGEYKKALEYHRLFHQADKEILDEKSNEQINKLHEKYESVKKAREIEVLKNNNEIQQLKLSKERIARNALIMGLILVSMIFALLFKKYLYLFAFWKKQKYVGQFRLMEKLGSGAVGTIYKAHSLMDKSEIAAVKVLRDELFTDDSSKKRFKREASIIDKLRHPNIIRIFEVGAFKEKLFIVMEFLEGRTLESKIREEGRLKLQESLHIMAQISDAIAYIHGKNIIHRDLKPDNIMLIETHGDPNFVKLLDFGLARMELESRLTQTGDFLGTLQYVSPEQVLDAHSVPANDIFSMGVTFYYMLSGKSPFAGETAIEIMRQIITKEPPGLSEARPDIPAELNDLVIRMMDKEFRQRPPAESIRDTLQCLEKSMGSKGTVIS
jgi:tetratricopeptide (TPR) repeat protein/tRNA A-37 threonylcarbamoyl transferase component Bud32